MYIYKGFIFIEAKLPFNSTINFVCPFVNRSRQKRGNSLTSVLNLCQYFHQTKNNVYVKITTRFLIGYLANYRNLILFSIIEIVFFYVKKKTLSQPW